MSGGSVHPDGPRSQQCSHCLLFFSPQGISNHEQSCNWKEVNVEEFAERVLSDTETSESGGGEPADAVANTESADGEEPGTSVEDAPDTSPMDVLDTSTSADADAARTDGSGLGLDGPPEAPTDQGDEPDDGDLDDDHDELECIGCGDPLGVTDDDLRERFGDGPAFLTCECGKEMRWSA